MVHEEGLIFPLKMEKGRQDKWHSELARLMHSILGCAPSVNDKRQLKVMSKMNIECKLLEMDDMSNPATKPGKSAFSRGDKREALTRL